MASADDSERHCYGDEEQEEMKLGVLRMVKAAIQLKEVEKIAQAG